MNVQYIYDYSLALSGVSLFAGVVFLVRSTEFKYLINDVKGELSKTRLSSENRSVDVVFESSPIYVYQLLSAHKNNLMDTKISSDEVDVNYSNSFSKTRRRRRIVLDPIASHKELFWSSGLSPVC
jgi:hypothetical protein